MKRPFSRLCRPIHQTVTQPPSFLLQMKECGIPSSDSSRPAAGPFQCRWSAWGRGSATSSESSLLIAMVTDNQVHPLLLSLVNAHTHTHTSGGQANEQVQGDPTCLIGVWLNFESVGNSVIVLCLLPSRGGVTQLPLWLLHKQKAQLWHNSKFGYLSMN